jgi:hypothetical protein
MHRLACAVVVCIGLAGCAGSGPLPSSAVDLLACTGPPSEVGGTGDGLSTDTGGATPNEALAAFLAVTPFVIPTEGYERIGESGDRVAYGLIVDGRPKAVIVVAPSSGEVTDAAYTVVELRTCPAAEFGAAAAFPDGRRVWTHLDSGAILTDFAGAEHCGWQSVRFLDVEQTDDRPPAQFIRDADGVLAGVGGLEAFAAGVDLPADAVDTRYRTAEGLELWSVADGAAVYVVSPAGVERWPRATQFIGCR